MPDILEGGAAPAWLRIIQGMQGLHLTTDLSGCNAASDVMTNTEALRALCLGAVAAAGLQAVGELFHRFAQAGGITGVVLLAESHLAVHTWPELGAVTLDVYVCNLQTNNDHRAQLLMSTLAAAFDAQGAEHHRLQRGGEVVA